jgi:Acyltransferase family
MSTENNSTQRLFALDFLKALSIVAVVSYHSIFLPSSSYQAYALPLEVIFAPLRFCVPVFFTISFVLLARGLERSNLHGKAFLIKRLQRLSIPTAFWFGIIVVLYLLKHEPVYDLAIKVLKGEIFSGAYFLIALAQLTVIFVILRNKIYKINVFIITVLLQIFLVIFVRALLASDTSTPILDILRIIDRPLFLYWIAYISIGAFFYKNWSALVELSSRISQISKIGLLSFGGLFFMIEQYNLFNVSLGKIAPFEYTSLSCIISVFLIFICSANIQEKNLSKPITKLILLLSKYSLGIFCVNGFLSRIFISIGTHFWNNISFSFFEILIMKLIGCILLVLISLGLSLCLDRWGLGMVVK